MAVMGLLGFGRMAMRDPMRPDEVKRTGGGCAIAFLLLSMFVLVISALPTSDWLEAGSALIWISPWCMFHLVLIALVWWNCIRNNFKDFHWVRANLFHDWEGGDWRAVKGYGPVYTSKPVVPWHHGEAHYDGECDDENQRIYIAPEFFKLSSKNKIRELFVHEISHAVSGSSSHKEEAGSKWPNEMARAAERAKGIGEHELADLIEKDREEWMNAEEEITP